MTRRLEFKRTEGGKSFVRGKTKKTRKKRPIPLRDLPQSGEDVLRAQREKRKRKREKVSERFGEKRREDEVDARQQRTLGEALCAFGERIESREGSMDDVVDDAYRRHPKQESGRSTISLLRGSKRSLKNNTKFTRVSTARELIR